MVVKSISNRSAACAAILLLSFAAACGSSDTGSSADGGGMPAGGKSGSSAVAGKSGSSAAGGRGGGSGGAAASGGASATGGSDSDAGDPRVDGGNPPVGTSGGTPVRLGTAVGFAILAKSGISTVPKSAVTGNIGVSPAAASYITGFSLIADSTNVFSTSTQVVGKVYAATYAPPTPSNMTTAVSDMQLAFTDAAGRAPDVTELGAGDIGGMTLKPGVYKWGTGLLIPTDVTLNGSATDVWIFQIAQTLTMSSAKNIYLTGGALAKNVFWQVSGQVVLNTTAHFEGIILSKTAITLKTGASINGRLFAQTAVMIDGSTIVEPAP